MFTIKNSAGATIAKVTEKELRMLKEQRMLTAQDIVVDEHGNRISLFY